METLNPIIFLDIDGVLCTQKGIEYHMRTSNETHDDYGQLFCPKAVECLDKIITTHHAEIVLISSWRKSFYSTAEIQKFFNDRKITWKVHSATGIYKKKLKRGEEIQLWMKKFGRPEKFVIIDDDADFDITEFFPGKTVNTNEIEGIADRRSYRRANAIIKRTEVEEVETKVNSIF